MLLTRLGIRSVLPASLGTQKLWMTSLVVNARAMASPVGMCSSLAVTTPRSGYSNSHHHWWPMTLTLRATGGVVAVSKMVVTVGTAMTTRIRAGAIVHAISS